MRRALAQRMSRGGAAGAALLLAGAAFAAPPAGGSVAPVSGADKEGRLQVQVFPQQQAVLSAEIAARISHIGLKEGERFSAGQTLVQFDCAMFQAQSNKAEAQLEAARQTLRVNKRLGELNSISNLEVEQAEAKVKEMQAEVAAMRVVVSKCRISAPFAGRVAKLHAEPFQYVTQGKPIIEIVDARNPEVRLIVPSRWLAWLRSGVKFTLHVDDLGRDYTARVTRLGARIDPVSQSVSAAAEIEGSPAELLPGMSGWAQFQVPR